MVAERPVAAARHCPDLGAGERVHLLDGAVLHAHQIVGRWHETGQHRCVSLLHGGTAERDRIGERLYSAWLYNAGRHGAPARKMLWRHAAQPQLDNGRMQYPPAASQRKAAGGPARPRSTLTISQISWGSKAMAMSWADGTAGASGCEW